jgi:hypothetical protein
MAINWTALEARAKEFNDIYHTSFNYSDFYSKLKTFVRLEPENATNIVYKGTLGTVLKDAMVAACHSRGGLKKGERGDVDLMDVVKNFE